MIYLASPYSHKNPEVVEYRYNAVMEMNQRMLTQLNLHVYSPIVHCHVMAKTFGMPTDAAWWEDFNHKTIDACDAVYVLTIGGWAESLGVQDEIAYAEETRKPVLYVDQNLTISVNP